MNEITPTEREAILLRWRMKNPDAPEGAGPTSEEAAQLLTEIRARQAAVEAEALAVLKRATKNDWTRSGFRSRYAQAFFLYFALPVMLLAGVFAAVDQCGAPKRQTQSLLQEGHMIVDRFGEVSTLAEIPTEEIQKAEGVYQQVLRLDPGNQTALAQLVFLSCLQQDGKSADGYIRQLQALPGSGAAVRQARQFRADYLPEKSGTNTLSGTYVAWAKNPYPKLHWERPRAALYNVTFFPDGSFRAHMESFGGLVSNIVGTYRSEGQKVVLTGESHYHYEMKQPDETDPFSETLLRKGELLQIVRATKMEMALVKVGSTPDSAAPEGE